MTRIVLLIALFGNVALGQNYEQTHTAQECGTWATPADVEQLNLLRTQMERRGGIQNRSFNTVPVTVHIVRQSDGSGGLTGQQIQSVIEGVNHLFADAFIEFSICGGIRFIDSDRFFYFQQTEEDILTRRFNAPNTLNIFFTGAVKDSKGNNLCGYAYFPAAAKDHVIMANSCALNGSSLAHELGHYFGLYHTHGKTNMASTDELVNGANCTDAGDDICDTAADPNISGKIDDQCRYTGGLTDRNGDAFQPDPANIMSYGRPDCRWVFTPGQCERMTFVLQHLKNQLSCNGLTAGFQADVNAQTCGRPLSVQFTYTGTGATSFEWDVDGDGRTDYTTAHPRHTYTRPGAYTVSLRVTNAKGEASQTFNQLVKLQPVVKPDFTEDFENGFRQWIIENPGQDGAWEKVNNLNRDHNTVVFLNNFDQRARGQEDYLVSPTIDLSKVSRSQLSFRVSYASPSPLAVDQLRVEVSTDCGASYRPVYKKSGAELATRSGNMTEKWIPRQASDWRMENIDLSAFDGQTITLRFVNVNGYGNVIYLDDVTVKAMPEAATPEYFELAAGYEAPAGNWIAWKDDDRQSVRFYVVEHFTGHETPTVLDTIWNKQAASKSDTDIRYLHEQPAVGEIHTYLVKAFDTDGSIRISQQATIDLSKMAAIRIFPNPAFDQTTVSWESTASGTVIMRIVDMQGRLVQAGNWESQAGNNQQNLPVQSLTSGMYQIMLEQSGRSLGVQQLIVAH